MLIGTALAFVCLALGTHDAFAQDVSHGVDPSHNFSSVRTWTWLGDRGTSTVHQYVADAIAGQLHDRGLTQASPGSQPDVLVVFDTNSEDTIRIVMLPMPGEPFARSSVSASARATSEPVRAVNIGIVDTKTGKMLWRATGRSDQAEANRDGIARIVRAMFRKYPTAPDPADF